MWIYYSTKAKNQTILLNTKIKSVYETGRAIFLNSFFTLFLHRININFTYLGYTKSRKKEI